jgi:hypothetical protein
MTEGKLTDMRAKSNNVFPIWQQRTSLPRLESFLFCQRVSVHLWNGCVRLWSLQSLDIWIIKQTLNLCPSTQSKLLITNHLFIFWWETVSSMTEGALPTPTLHVHIYQIPGTEKPRLDSRIGSIHKIMLMMTTSLIILIKQSSVIV